MKPVSSDWSATDAAAAAGPPIVVPPMKPEQRARIDSLSLYLRYWRSALIALVGVTAPVVVMGHQYAPLETWAIWGSLAAVNTLCQAVVCRVVERAGSLADAVRRWLPWLLVSITFNGVLWGLLPLLVSTGPPSLLVFTCLFNAMLLFCIANTPATPSMLFCATIPVGVLGAATLVWHQNALYAGGAFAASIAVISFYGLRLQAVIRAGLIERYVAEALAVDLRENQQQLVTAEHERAVLLERQRLTRDLHDGLGSTLIASLTAVERGEAHSEQLAATLRECIDDLRMVVDSIDPISQDLVALLANIRFRLERRLVAAGIELEWKIEDLPLLTWLGPPEALHVFRIVQEVFGNVIRHSAAQHVQLGARTIDDHVEVCIVDDGCGFDLSTVPRGRGLKYLDQRAAALGGKLEIESRLGHGTTIRLELPIRV